MFLKTSSRSAVLIVAMVSGLLFSLLRTGARLRPRRSVSVAGGFGSRLRRSGFGLGGLGFGAALGLGGRRLGGFGLGGFGVGFGARPRPRRFGSAAASGSAALRARAREALAAGDALVDEGLEAVGHVAGERLEQAGRLDERGLEPAGEPGEQHLARAARRRAPRSSASAEHAVVEQAALHDEVRVGPGEVAQRLGGQHRVAGDEGDRDRPLEQRHDARRARCPRRPGGPACS